MKKIAIIGSGQTGLLAAHGLLQQGHIVSLYSDRSAEDWLHRSRPTGTAARFGMALDYERELGLNHWESLAPKAKGVHLSFSTKDDNTLVTLAGKFPDSFAQAIDLRLQCHRWMNDFEQQGGKLYIEKVTISRLDEIAGENDLSLVAVGRGGLADIFPRNAERSVYDKPQRKLAMLIVKDEHPMGFKGVPYLPIKINFLAQYGEAFWMPFYHKTEGLTWSLLFEAKEGGKMDQFDACKTGENLLAQAKKVINEIMPHDYDWCKHLKMTDELGWITGKVAPTIRNPIGRLPSGNIVMPIGDTAISMDPIGGQGANLGNKFVKHLVHAVSHHTGEYNANWIQQTFETFWDDHGQATVRFNNALLEPLTQAGKLLMISQYGSTGNAASKNQLIANAIIDNFRDPRKISDAFLDEKEAKKVIHGLTNTSWNRIFFPSLFNVAKGQFRQAFGLSPKHPLSAQTFLLDKEMKGSTS